MTALTVPARPKRDAGLRPVPWRRMAWVTWRQHRAALAGVAALLGALAVYLWLVGPQLHHAYARPSLPPGQLTRLRPDQTSTAWYDATAIVVSVVLQAVPALIGAFVGAPVLARELETGTFRYAWTQGFGRWRWTLAKLVPLAVVVAAAAGAFSVLFSWYYQPYFAAGYSRLPFAPGVFDLRGVAFAAWTLAAFAIGALAGMLIRRVVPAIAATLAVYAGLAFAAGLFLRQHYLTPLVTSNLNLPGSAWIIKPVGTPRAARSRSATMARSIVHAVRQICAGPWHGTCGRLARAATSPSTATRAWTSYQPASRFWPFQWIEGGWLLALSVLLIAVTVWLVRRRAT